MTDRAYTVSQVDDLRKACENKWLYGYYNRGITGCGRTFREEEKTACVEQLVRTSMLAGHTAEDLYESERPLIQSRCKHESEIVDNGFIWCRLCGRGLKHSRYGSGQ